MSEKGDLIRQWRQSLGLSIRDLAERTGLARESIASAERGQARESTTARLLAELRRVSDEVGVAPPPGESSPRAELEIVIFNVLADRTSDLEWLEDVGKRLADAIAASGLLRP